MFAGTKLLSHADKNIYVARKTNYIKQDNFQPVHGNVPMMSGASKNDSICYAWEGLSTCAIMRQSWPLTFESPPMYVLW